MNGSQPGSDHDSGDSRKRPSEHDSDTGSTKKANAGDNVHYKILVPSIAAGAIIGKGGEAIAKVQRESGAKVKMSKANDFYPGTTERVCLIVGNVEAIKLVHYYIMDRILEKPDPNPRTTADGRLNVERHKQVKIMVPNSTAGMIIGKGGSYIKEIKETSGAYVQISQKAKEVNLPERCVTIAGDKEQNRTASDMILTKIAEDPQSASCPNISYADVSGPVASAYPTGSPYAFPAQPVGVGLSSGPSSLMGAVGGQPALSSPPLSMVPSPGSSFNLSGSTGFHTLLTGPASPATLVSPRPGLLQDDYSLSFQATDHQMAMLSPTGAAVFQDFGGGATAAASLMAFHDDRHSPSGLVKREIQVSENLVGVILGQQGKAIVELQAQTNTSIQISKKGVYAPGTRNRMITVTGPPTNVARAAILITQRVQNEEERRQHAIGHSPQHLG